MVYTGAFLSVRYEKKLRAVPAEFELTVTKEYLLDTTE